jgi:hypothetical protein
MNMAAGWRVFLIARSRPDRAFRPRNRRRPRPRRVGTSLRRLIAHRLEGSRFGTCIVGLANSPHDEPGQNMRQQAAPANVTALRSSMRRA